jgi:hypothetical protein
MPRPRRRDVHLADEAPPDNDHQRPGKPSLGKARTRPAPPLSGGPTEAEAKTTIQQLVARAPPLDPDLAARLALLLRLDQHPREPG